MNALIAKYIARSRTIDRQAGDKSTPRVVPENERLKTKPVHFKRRSGNPLNRHWKNLYDKPFQMRFPLFAPESKIGKMWSDSDPG